MHTFEEFKKQVDAHLLSKVGLSSDCIADCNWSDLFEDCEFERRGTVDGQEVIDTAIEYNPEIEEFL